MSKILFIGDIHTKQNIVKRVEELLNEDKEIEKVVFVGDYVDDWKTNYLDNINILNTMFNLKRKYKDKIELLWGNHEHSYFGYACSGHKYLDDDFPKLLSDNLDLFNIIYKTDDFICSHAGITENWFTAIKEKYNIKDDNEMLDKINELFHKEDKNMLELLSVASVSSGGYSDFASPLWSRPSDHTYSPINLGRDQIVGHTPNELELKYRTKNVIVDGLEILDRIVYIDTFSTYPVTLEPIGKEEILIFNNEDKVYLSKSLLTDKEEFIFQRR